MDGEVVSQHGSAAASAPEDAKPEVRVTSIISRIPEVSGPEQTMGAEEDVPTDGAAAAATDTGDSDAREEPESTTEEGQGTEAPGEKPHPKSKEGRIARLTKEKHEERRLREAAETQLKTLESRLAALEAGVQKPPEPAPEPVTQESVVKRPRMEEFIGDDGELDEEKFAAANEAYVESLVERKLATKDQTAAQKEQAVAQQKAAEEAKKAVEQVFAAFDDRATAYAKTSETFDDAQAALNAMLTSQQAFDASKNPLGFVSQTAAVVGEILVKSEQGPQLIDHLGQNPEEADEILALDPVTAAVRLGALVTRLADGGRTPRRVKTGAPPPPATVGSGRGRTTVDPKELAKDPKAYAEAMGLLRQGY